MNIDITETDARVLARLYPEGPDRTGESTLALYRVCRQVRDKLPRPFEAGDIVHNPYRTPASYARMEVKAIAHDGVGREHAWCLDANGNLIPLHTDDLAHGERS